jgi:hypothetical protein
MANLSVSELQQRIAAPKNKGLIEKCEAQHERLRYHVEPVEQFSDIGKVGHDAFMKWVETLLPADKYTSFERFYRPPVATVEVTEQVYAELGRALEADNQYIKSDFKNPENANDFEAYRIEIGDTRFWGTEALEASKTQINSIIICDLPQVQITDKPAPYYYLLEICPAKVVDVDFKKDGTAEYVIFNETGDKNTLYCYDDSFFRILQRPNDSQPYQLLHEAQHTSYDAYGRKIAGLGYCPARRFWNEQLTRKNRIQARAPITKVLGKLDEYLFDYVSLRYYASYGTWPITWEYEDSEPKHIYPRDPKIVCNKGFFVVPAPKSAVSNSSGSVVVENPPTVYACEECRKSKYTGPGSVKRVSAPTGKSDSDLREPAGFINPNPEILKAAEASLERKKAEIIAAVTGAGGEPSTAQPRNELDVQSGYEQKQSYLLRFKRNIEDAQGWTDETLAILRYADDYIRNAVDLGDEFYLRTEAQLSNLYADSKKAGLPAYLLAPIRDLISQTRYRNNDEQRMKQDVLAALQPYPDLSDGELQAWVTAAPQTTNIDLLSLRNNFDSYVRRFERENQMSVVDFGSAIPFNAKIERIKARLMEYVKGDSGNSPEPVNKPIVQPSPTVEPAAV